MDYCVLSHLYHSVLIIHLTRTAERGDITQHRLENVKETPFFIQVNEPGIYQMKEPPNIPKLRGEPFLKIFSSSEVVSRDASHCKAESLEGEAIVTLHPVPR